AECRLKTAPQANSHWGQKSGAEMTPVTGRDDAVVGGRDPSLATAIAALAGALSSRSEPNGGSFFWKTVSGVIETLLPSVVMSIVGFVFIQGVELDLKRAEFTASSAEKLKSYILILSTPPRDMSGEELNATALATGGFGAVAAFPLVNIVD